MEGVKEELHRAKSNEKRLMDANKELKNKLSVLGSTEISLKKERVEVARLKKKVNTQDLHVDRLREELSRVKTELKSLEVQSSQEKNVAEQKIMDLEKKGAHFENCFCIEKTLREQKEKELEKLYGTNEKNKKLTKQLFVLEHEVEELKGYKNFAARTMAEGTQQLKKSEMENLKRQTELNKIRSQETHYRDLEEDLISCKKSLKSATTLNENREREIKQQAKQIDEHKGEIYKLKRKTVTLTKTIEDRSFAIEALENQVDSLKRDKKSFTEQLEAKNRETEVQQCHILKLEDRLNTLAHLEQQIDKKDKEIARLTVARDEQIIGLQSLINELQKRLQLQIIETKETKFERDQSSSNLVKAQQELDSTHKTIKDLDSKIRDQKLRIDAKNFEVTKIKRKYCSVRKQLENLRREHAETRRIQTVDKIAASRDWILAEKGLAMMVSEKQVLERELVLCAETILQQQQTINQQEAGRVAQESEMKEIMAECDFLRREIRVLNHKVFILDRTRMARFPHFLQRERTRAKRKTVRPLVFIKRKLESQEKKDKEIEELKRMLARRPDDAIRKLQQCKWANRDLNKKFMASQACLVLYEEKYNTVMEENTRLTDELRELNFKKFTEKTKCHLPPVNKVKSPPEGKSECQSRHTCPPSTTPRFQNLFEDIFKTVPLPPIRRSVTPKPPPPKSD